MPDEVKITRRQVIVVGEIKGIIEKSGQFPNPKWVFTDKEGNEFKINPGRTKFFEDVIPGRAVEISFTTFKGTEYPYNAVAIDTRIPEQSVDEQFNALKKEQEYKGKPPNRTEMLKEDWAEKDRITRKSIERQTALKESNLRTPAEGDADAVLATASKFAKWLADGEIPVKPNRVVEAAKKLGAEETKGEAHKGIE